METRSLETTTVRIYPRDHLQIWEILSPSALAEIRERFGFEEAETGTDEDDDRPNRVLFARGYPDPDTIGPRTIRSLDIRDQRIEVTGISPDGHATLDQFLGHLGATLGSLIGREDGGKWFAGSITETSTTVWIGRLDIDADTLLAPPLRALAGAVREACETKQAKPLLGIKSVSFRLTFDIRDTDLLESWVYFRDKEFRLEPRGGVPARERMWFSTCPLRSELHLELLNRLEQDLTEGK